MSDGRVNDDDDFYAVLGVRTDADAGELRRAWRELASRWHPDRAGPAATRTFQRLSAAYAVLSDPLARVAYDRRRAPAPGAHVPTPPATARPSPPPRPAPPSAPAVMLSRLSKSLWLLLTSGAARYDDGDPPGFVTLVLRPDEAAQGGMVAIPMRIDVRCPACAASASPSAACGRCRGTRRVEELFSAWLAVRPGVAAGEVLVPSAELPGAIDPVRVRVEIFQKAV